MQFTFVYVIILNYKCWIYGKVTDVAIKKA